MSGTRAGFKAGPAPLQRQASEYLALQKQRPLLSLLAAARCIASGHSACGCRAVFHWRGLESATGQYKAGTGGMHAPLVSSLAATRDAAKRTPCHAMFTTFR